ncbi:MAG: MFS transporter [Clostridia bacterium]|nr:MFS transporter [Clostridia bacterium]
MSISDKISKFKDTVVNNPSFTLKEQVAYSGGIFGNAMGQDCIMTFEENFTYECMGISTERRQIMDNVNTVIGFFIPPIAGAILDKPTRPGHLPASKKILRITPLPFAVVSMLLFLVPSTFIPSSLEPALLNFIWTFVFKFVFDTVDAFFDMSLGAMSLRMTNNENDRKNFFTISTLAASLGSMLPGWVTPIFLDKLDGVVPDRWIYFWCALVFCVLGFIGMNMPHMWLNEKVQVQRGSEDGAAVWNRNTVKALMHNRTFIVLQIASLFENIRAISYQMLNYLYRNTFDNFGMKAIIDMISGALSYVGLAAVPFLGRRFHARTIASAGFTFTGVLYGVMSLFNIGFDVDRIRKIRYVIGVLIGIAGMPNNAISAAKKIITADSTDYMEWYSEKNLGEPVHAEGLLCAAGSLLGKVFLLIKKNIYLGLFRSIGYQQNSFDEQGNPVRAQQTPATLHGIYLIFTLCGLVGNALAAVTFLFDNYDGKKRDEIRAELDAMRAARAKNASGAAEEVPS